MKKKIILSAGGTGGHLFPAQSLAEDLEDWEILFVAGGLSQNRFFEKSRFSFEEVSCSTFSLSKPLQMLKGSGPICKGLLKSKKILRSFSPDCVVGFGSFFTLPVLLAAALHKIPIVLHEQNAIPGKVNRVFSRFAHTTAITFPHSAGYLKGNCVEVQFPLRSKTFPHPSECYTYFGLEATKPTLLIFGGSAGAVKLNRVVLEACRSFRDLQVIHFTGSEERVLEAKNCYDSFKIKACVKAFEPHMDRAMHIADVAITRAGASTVAELIEYGVPALVIPYPFATDGHQEKNAEHFVKIVKGGMMLLEKNLNRDGLIKAIDQLLSEQMRTKMQIQEYKKSREIQHLSHLVKDILL